MRPLVQVFAFLALSATAFACGSDDDDGDPAPTPQGVQGEAGLCVDLVLVQRTLDRVMALDESSTIEEAEAARDALNLALTEIQQAGELLTTGQNSELQQAFATFDAAVDALGSGGASTSDTLGPAVVPLKVSAQELQVTVDDIESESSCPQ